MVLTTFKDRLAGKVKHFGPEPYLTAEEEEYVAETVPGQLLRKWLWKDQ